MTSPDASVRLAWPDDAPAIARVQLAAWAALWPDLVDALDVDEVAAHWRRAISAPPDARVRLLVALEGATVRGLVVVHPNTDEDADPVADGEIGELVVDPAHLGAGHGSRLVQAAVDTLRADRFQVVRWWVSTTDDALRTFATSTGFAADGAHRALEDETGTRVKQVRLHAALTER